MFEKEKTELAVDGMHLKKFVLKAIEEDGRALHGANNTPTVDVKPIVHAHWIEGQTDNPNIHNILCSHCFEGYPSDSQYTKKKFQWCPHCVARH